MILRACKLKTVASATLPTGRFWLRLPNAQAAASTRAHAVGPTVDRIDIARETELIDGYNWLCALRDPAGDIGRVDIVGDRVGLGEDRRCADMADDVDRVDEHQRRHDHLAKGAAPAALFPGSRSHKRALRSFLPHRPQFGDRKQVLCRASMRAGSRSRCAISAPRCAGTEQPAPRGPADRLRGQILCGGGEHGDLVGAVRSHLSRDRDRLKTAVRGNNTRPPFALPLFRPRPSRSPQIPAI
jgi:hypothetical protein